MRDISRAHEGIIKTMDWGYHELPNNMELRDCVHLYGFEKEAANFKDATNITITKTHAFRYYGVDKPLRDFEKED
jgi:hypothetical protein